MSHLVEEWVEKAEGDILTAGRKLQARKSPNFDAVCFHAQQCAEKYIKGFLQKHNQHIPMIHNLIELMMLCEEIDPTLEMLRADLIVLERYAVRVRYPGTSAFKDEAQAAYQAAKVVREFCRPKLGLS